VSGVTLPPFEGRGAALRFVGLGVILAAALTRMMVGFDPFPGWDADPFVLPVPETQFGPAASMLLDAVTFMGAAVAMLGVAFGGRPAHPMAWLAVGAGAAAVVWHSRLGGEVAIDHFRLGSQWVAAFVGGAAAFEVCREVRARRLVLASLIGAVCMLACKGALQVFLEHPQTVSMYKQTRLEFFASQGWTPDSAAARAFERRLLQPEATGWFGMANVFASWGAFGAASLLSVLLLMAGTRARIETAGGWVKPVLTLGAVASLACAAMAGAKGGWAALAVGLGVGACLWLASRSGTSELRRERVLRLLRYAPVACVALAISAVLCRGLIGERLAEASILFRWFYVVGAARTIAGHPLAGVGPDGFKDSYMLVKPPLSPEEVTSPHSLFFDFGATLGIAGIAWGLLWLAWVWKAGTWLALPPGPVPPTSDAATTRSDARLFFLILSVPTVIGALVEVRAGTPEGTVARMVGLALSTAVATSVSVCLRASAAALGAVACGSAALAAHAQIELTPIWPGSAPAFMLVFGALGAGPLRLPDLPDSRAIGRRAVVVALSLVLLTGAWLSLGWRPVHRWEQRLDSALAAAEPAAEAREVMAKYELGTPTERADAAGQLSDMLSAALGRPIGDSEAALRRGNEDLFLLSGGRALTELDAAASHVTHPGTLRAVSRLALQLSATYGSRSESAPAEKFAERATDAADRAAAIPFHRASSLGWLGTVHANIAEATGDRAERELAVDAWEGAARADPWGPTWPPKLARAVHDLGRVEEARAWARKALEIDELSRLDPLRSLTDSEKAEMSRLAAGS